MGATSLGAEEAGTVVSLHYPTGYFGEASVNHTVRQCSLPAQDTLSGWHIACGIRANGFSGQACAAGAQAEGKPDTIPLSLCRDAGPCQQPVPVRSNAREKRQTIKSAGKNPDREMQGDELGKATKAGIQYFGGIMKMGVYTSYAFLLFMLMLMERVTPSFCSIECLTH